MPFESDIRQDKQVDMSAYEIDNLWRRKSLTPAQLLVHEVVLETLQRDQGPLLEINEKAASQIVPDSAALPDPRGHERVLNVTSNPIERQSFSAIENDFGWIRHLRLDAASDISTADVTTPKCRWIHCSSKFPEYIRGFLWALSNDDNVATSMRLAENAIQRFTRFSKHGKYFVPFSEILQPQAEISAGKKYPMLIVTPFLDWTVQGSPPPLRFQIDKREGYQAAKSSAHVLRSVLQWYFRLEDTSDREGHQVFANHKPWTTNRELDLKTRSFYGHYPTKLNVDELWILAVDESHVVTWSANQTWKSLWPPLQLPKRISDVSFRALRNHFFGSENPDFTALTMCITCLTGAVGILHRNFWPDIVLCLTDRYAGRLGHLQYRLYRSPSTKLVMDLIACQEELNIVIQITEQQIEMISELQSKVEVKILDKSAATSPTHQRPASSRYHRTDEPDFASGLERRATFRQISASSLSDPTAQLLDNLQRELVDLIDLRGRTDMLVTRTIQLVNIRVEDNGKVLLIFTIVTLIFLPLNFISSFFGMNFSDIRDMDQTQSLFWIVAICVTFGVVSLSILVAFNANVLYEKTLLWREGRREMHLSTMTTLRQNYAGAYAGHVT